MKRLGSCAAAAALAFTTGIAAAQADEVTVDMHLIDAKGVGAKFGTVHARDTDNGLVLKLDLAAELRPGPHGFHVHQNGDCGTAQKDGDVVAGLAAGGHYDPENTGTHMGPSGTGHLGDLPVIQVEVDEDGARPVKRPMVAPRLSVEDIRGRALVIHADGDNYRDEPKPLGGGGARAACGVVPSGS